MSGNKASDYIFLPVVDYMKSENNVIESNENNIIEFMNNSTSLVYKIFIWQNILDYIETQSPKYVGIREGLYIIYNNITLKIV